MKQIILILSFVMVAGALKAQTTLFTKDTLANNAVFRQRVKSATIIAANQLAADTSQPQYIYTYCNTVINSPDGGWISAITYQVVANPAISYESSDGDIQFTVNSNIDKCARAFGNVPPEGAEAAPDQSNINAKDFFPLVRLH